MTHHPAIPPQFHANLWPFLSKDGAIEAVRMYFADYEGRPCNVFAYGMNANDNRRRLVRMEGAREFFWAESRRLFEKKVAAEQCAALTRRDLEHEVCEEAAEAAAELAAQQEGGAE